MQLVDLAGDMETVLFNMLQSGVAIRVETEFRIESNRIFSTWSNASTEAELPLMYILDVQQIQYQCYSCMMQTTSTMSKELSEFVKPTSYNSLIYRMVEQPS